MWLVTIISCFVHQITWRIRWRIYSFIYFLISNEIREICLISEIRTSKCVHRHAFQRAFSVVKKGSYKTTRNLCAFVSLRSASTAVFVFLVWWQSSSQPIVRNDLIQQSFYNDWPEAEISFQSVGHLILKNEAHSPDEVIWRSSFCALHRYIVTSLMLGKVTSLISYFSYFPQRLTLSPSLLTLLLPSFVLCYIIWTELLNDTLQN